MSLEIVGLITIWAIGIIAILVTVMTILLFLVYMFGVFCEIYYKRGMKARFYVTFAIISSYVNPSQPLRKFESLCKRQMISKGFNGEQAVKQLDSAIESLKEIRAELTKESEASDE